MKKNNGDGGHTGEKMKSAVKQRLHAQRAKSMAEISLRDFIKRESILELEAKSSALSRRGRSKVSVLPNETNRYIEDFSEGLLDDDSVLGDISVAGFDSVDTWEREEEAAEIAAKETEEAIASMRQDRNFVTLNHYVTNLSLIDETEWNEKQIQTARVLVELEHPRRINPSVRGLIQTVLKDNGKGGADFEVGDWVEIQGLDTNWNLDLVYKVQNFEGEYFYNVGARRRLRRYEIRAPQDGLLRVFGTRPWIWQQWAILKLEHQLCFHQGHRNDFEVFNIAQYARDLWFQWLNNPQNKDFKEHLADPRVEKSQENLFDHMMKPFYQMDDMRREDGWDFNDPEVSIFTYLNLHGSGYALCLVTIFLQFTIPSLLLIETIENAGYVQLRKDNPDMTPFEWLTNVFCVVDDAANCFNLIATSIVVMCIQALYLFKVVPDTIVKFRSVIGVGGYGPVFTYARIKAISQIVADKNLDRIGQSIGKIFDLYMNTLYVYFLYMLNIFNILNQASPTEVVLNALALEFVFRIDEEYAKSVWWDPGRRWLKAGTIEITMQSVLETRVLSSPRLFSDKYGISVDEILVMCDDNDHLLYDADSSRHDRKNINCFDDTELFEYFSQKRAESKKCAEIKQEFTKLSRIFGKPEQHLLDLQRLVLKFFCSRDFNFNLGVFNRHINYRTWSRWEKVLYLSKIPNVSNLFEMNSDNLPIIKKELEKIKHTSAKPFSNFSPNSTAYDANKALRRRQYQVLTFQKMKENVRQSLYQKDYDRVVFWLLNGILEWVAFVVQYGFPMYNLICLGLFPYCLENVKALFDEQGFTRCDCKLIGNGVPEACVDYLVDGFNEIFANDEGGYDCDAVGELYREMDYDLVAIFWTIAGKNNADALACVLENE